MVEKIQTVHQKDTKYRLQRNDETAKYYKTTGTICTPDQRFVHLGTERVSDNGKDKNR